MDIVTISGSGANSGYELWNGYCNLSNPTYWRGTNFKVSNLASFDIDVYQDGVKVQESHPLDPFFSYQANSEQSADSHWHTWYFHGEDKGNGYSYVRRDPNDLTSIMGFYNLMPEDVTVFRMIPEGGAIWDASVWYWHAPSKIAIPSADVLHYRPYLAYDGLIGYSPQDIMASTFRRAAALGRYQTRVIERGTAIKGSIEFPEQTKRETITEVLDTIKKFRAATGDRDLIVLTGGAKLNNTALSPGDLQSLEQDRELTKKICQAIEVDPRFVYEKSEGKYTDNAEAAGDDIMRFTFRTRIDRIQAELTRKLLSPTDFKNGLTIRLDPAALVRGDVQTMMTIAATGANQGITTPNEARQIIGVAPDSNPESDKLRTPTHLVAPSSGGSDATA